MEAKPVGNQFPPTNERKECLFLSPEWECYLLATTRARGSQSFPSARGQRLLEVAGNITQLAVIHLEGISLTGSDWTGEGPPQNNLTRLQRNAERMQAIG